MMDYLFKSDRQFEDDMTKEMTTMTKKLHEVEEREERRLQQIAQEHAAHPFASDVARIRQWTTYEKLTAQASCSCPAVAP